MSLDLATLSAAAFSIITFATGCADAPGSAAAITSAAIDTGDGSMFSPAHLTVAAGTPVQWRNNGVVPHTVTSGASSKATDSPGTRFDGQLPAGGTFAVTFTEVGDYPYFCRFHEAMGMTGVVTVTAAPPDEGGGAYAGGDGY
jgi:plastocyanin